MSERVGYIKNLADQSLAHVVYSNGQLSIAVPIGHLFEMVAEGDLPLKEYLEADLPGQAPHPGV